MKNKKLAAVVLAVVVLTAIIILTLVIRRPSTRMGREAVEYEEALHSKQADQTESGNSSSMAKTIQKSEVATPEIMMLQYRLQYRYPEHSRPLTRAMVDLLDPFSIRPSKVPYFVNKPPGPDEKPAFYYSWTGPSYMITGNTPAVAALEVFDPDSGARMHPKILGTEVFSDQIFGRKLVGQADSNDAGVNHDATANDGKTTIVWTPRTGERLHWGELLMKVRFDTPNAKNAEITADFNSTPSVPASFAGQFSDRLDNGSLVIDAAIDVKKPGKYIIEANLLDKDSGEPLHRVYLIKYLEAGRQIVGLDFFGVIFHDRDFSSGKLVLANLRGHRVNLPFDPRRLNDMLARGEQVPTNNEPLQEWMPPAASDFVTSRSYDVGEFSSKEYEGPDKETRLKQIEQFSREWEKQHGSGPR